jgi:hypothetical protein
MARAKKQGSSKVVTMPAAVTTRVYAVPSAGPTLAEIAARAYELFCERQYSHGHDVEDWLQAERELRQGVSSAA